MPADLLPARRSGFRPGHPTETSVLRVLKSDILLAIDCGDLAALVLFDLTAAFDTVDHDILLERPQMSFDINNVAIHTCLDDGSSYTVVSTTRSVGGDARSILTSRLCVVCRRGQY